MLTAFRMPYGKPTGQKVILMKKLVCENCGSTDFRTEGNVRICSYCDTRYVLEPSDIGPRTSTISLDDDIRRLLGKCEADPEHARRYANLVLDLDPGNRQALRYL